MTRVIGPGEMYTFSRPCDDLQAIVIHDADLGVVGDVDDSSDVLVDGTDFNCGDTITFTFSHADVVLPIDLDIGVDVN